MQADPNARGDHKKMNGKAAIHAMVAPLVSRFFLGFRARAFSVALICFGLAVVAPPGLKGFVAFLQAPPGLSVVALVLVAIGVSVEETGTIRRIRWGIALRLLSVPILVAAVFWAMVIGSPLPSLVVMGFVLGGMGAIGVGLALQHDWATYADVRHGQPVRLEELTSSGLEIESNGQHMTVAIDDILMVRAVGNLDGRAVIFLLNENVRKRKDTDVLPRIGATREGDAFVLTEHQAGMDADDLVARLIEMMASGKRELQR
jgi:hypothetical protein